MGIPTPIIIFVVLILIVGIYFMTKGKKKPDSNTIASEATGEEAETTTEATEATGEEAETTITKEEEEEEEEEVKKEEGVTIGQLQESIATPPQTDNTPTATEAVVSQEAISAPPSIPGVTVATATADDSVPDVPVPVPAAVNCVGGWGDWSACSVACGGGNKSRTYAVTTPASGSGEACIKQNGEVEEISCNSDPCPIDCVGEWGAWGACSASCGGGEQTRTFTQTTPAAHGGTACVAGQNAVSRQACNTQPCPVNCQGGWGAWSACSRNEQGYQNRNYTINTPAAHGGSTTTCEKPNNYIEGQFCNSGNPYWQGAPNSGTALNDITAVQIAGPTGANAIPGSLEFMGKWDQYNRNCGSWSNRSCETGVAMYINDEHRATMHRWAKGGGSDITTAWKRISGVNSGDNIKVVETGDRTQNAKMAWIFHPNDTTAHPRSLPDIQP